jgi:hypothetical protein
MQTNCGESWFDREIGESVDLPKLGEPHTHISGGTKLSRRLALRALRGSVTTSATIIAGDCIFDGVTRAQAMPGRAD